MKDASHIRALLALTDTRLLRQHEVTVEPIGPAKFRRIEVYTHYEHSANSRMIRIDEGVALLINQFAPELIGRLSIFVVALELCANDGLEMAIGHIYKRVFAEVLLGQERSTIGGALLIEALFHERERIGVIHDELFETPELQGLRSIFSQLTLEFVVRHEEAHALIRENETGARAVSEALFDGSVGREFERMVERHGFQWGIELLCDAHAMNSVLHAVGQDHPGLSRSARARMLSFILIVLADLTGLHYSAQMTIEASSRHDGIGQRIPVVIERCDPVDERCHFLIGALEGELAQLGEELYCSDEVFTLNKNLPSRMKKAFKNIDAIDSERREAAQFIAEALRTEPKAMEHLLWRSKKFRVGPTEIDP